MEKSSFIIFFIYILTLLFMGGVYSFYWFLLFSLLLLFWGYKKYYTVIKYKVYRDFRVNIELPILVFILYSFIMFIPLFHNTPDVNFLKEFNDLWTTLKIAPKRDSNFINFHYFSATVEVLMILSAYLWIKLILLYRKKILSNYKYLFILYNLVIITSFFNLGIAEIFSPRKVEILGFFVNDVHFATFITVPLPIIIFYLFKGKNKTTSEYIFKSLYIMVILYILASLHERMSVLSILIVLFIYFLIYIKNNRLKNINKKKILFLIILIIILGLTTTYTFMERGRSILFKREFVETLNLNFRLEALSISWNIFKDNWLLGIGAGQFSLVYPLYSKNELFFMHHLHNEYLQFLVEYGVLGVSIIFWGYFNLFKTIIYGIKNLKSVHKNLFIAHLFAILIFHIQIVSDFQLHIGALLLMLLFFITMLYVIIYDCESHQKKKNEIKNI